MASVDGDTLDRSLNDIFQEGYTCLQNLDKRNDPTNSPEFQLEIKKCMKLFEDSTRLQHSRYSASQTGKTVQLILASSESHRIPIGSSIGERFRPLRVYWDPERLLVPHPECPLCTGHSGFGGLNCGRKSTCSHTSWGSCTWDSSTILSISH
uniref:Uncharacterized protein n=1 Tax=Phlebotomus papatasi TaxID=29031 RepID=A0A1B0DKL8_PHLPP